AFDAWVAREAARTGVPPELAAARVIGRWRDGSPLVAEQPPVAAHLRNHFQYADAAEPMAFLDENGARVTAPRVPGDPRGARCPFSAHLRKVNPRDATTEEGAAAATLRRSMLRRGI